MSNLITPLKLRLPKVRVACPPGLADVLRLDQIITPWSDSAELHCETSTHQPIILAVKMQKILQKKPVKDPQEELHHGRARLLAVQTR